MQALDSPRVPLSTARVVTWPKRRGDECIGVHPSQNADSVRCSAFPFDITARRAQRSY